MIAIAITCISSGGGWADGDAVFGEMRPQRIDEGRSLADQQVANLVRHQNALLLSRLHRDKAHCRLRHGFADGLGICRIGLASFHVGLDVGRRHEPNVMAERHELATPMMG